MVKTRRKSKAAAAQQAELETASEDLSFTVPIPDDLDTDTLANFLPDASFAKPDPHTVLALYRLLLAQVKDQDDTRRDLEELSAELDRKNVELDQAIQDGESKTKDLDAALDAVQNQVVTITQERDQLIASNKDLEARVASFSTSHSTTVSDIGHLTTRVDDSEREKRDLITVVSRLKEDAAQRDDEVQNLRASLRQARQDYQSLESQLRELRAADTSTKFRLESLTQQLTLAQSEAERANDDLTAKSDEYANYRRTQHAEFIQLQSSHDALSQKHARAESSLRAMQSAQAASTQQLTQALTKVQELQGRLAEQEAAFTAEVSGLKRLVTIMEEREKQAKDIVESIEREWSGVGELAERRETELRAETDKERRIRQDLEKRLEQLETVMDRMHRGDLPAPLTLSRASTSIDHLSPTVAMASRVQKSGKTFTQVYADYVRLEEDLAKKTAECEHMDRTLSDLLAQIEERAPILAQQRDDYERLREESLQLSNQLATALAERDANAAAFQDASQKLTKSHQEANLLQQQLTDLGRQVQTLLQELGRRTDPSLPPDDALDALSPLPADTIDNVITNNLVLFRSIPALQEQNQALLRIVRELGAKMEAEERAYREALEKEQSEAVQEAHAAIQDLALQLERQKKSAEVTIQAYMKERDTLKAMLSRAERASSSSVRVNGDAHGTAAGDAATSGRDVTAELEDVQAQFASYRAEMGLDAEKLRDEVVHAQRQLGQANAALAKANAKIEYLDERQRMTQEQLAMQNRDLDGLSLRNQQLYDQQMRLDMERVRVTDELAATKSDLDQLRHEAANLRAEKRIWESVQGRLIDENTRLTTERAQLSDLMANVQRMHHDLERSGENDRRRLESQVQMLEDRTQDLKTQLTQERETVRHVTLQKDMDTKELQTRLDKSTDQLAQVRESLVAAETSRSHLQARVEELTRSLQGNAEKLAVYERRTSTTASGGGGGDAATGAGVAASAPDADVPLEREVAELRSQLKVAQVDLAAARSHMLQFQEISQANEAALAALNTTHDEYKTDAEARLARQELEYKSLEEKLYAVQQDVAQWTRKCTELQQTLDAERAAWANDKKTLEETIVDMTTSERHLEHDRAAHEREVRALEQRAVAAEERYAREVVTHAESFKALERLKHERDAAQATARQHLADATNAQAKLEASEGSWQQQKAALDKEVSDLNARCKDLAAQNALLYQHLESVSSQAARIRQVADTTSEAHGDSDVDVASADADAEKTKLSELRSVVAYLRKEKEIVDLQLELSKQESVRFKTQVDHLHQNLADVRKTLSEERERAVQAAASETQHAEMLERIQQLNILRESNMTLRADCETHAKRARELDAKLQTLSAELDPAKEQARVARAELEARDAQVALLESESRRWQERNAQLLSKYDRIDPAEVQTLKDEIERLKAQKAEVEARLTENDAKHAENASKVATTEDIIRKLRGMNNNLRQQLGTLNSEKSTLNRTMTELQAELKSAVAERDALRVSAPGPGTEASKESVEALRQEKAALEKALADAKAAVPVSDQSSLVESLRSERDALLAEKESWRSASAGDASDAVRAPVEAEKAELAKARDEALERLKAAEERANKAMDDAKHLKQSNDKFQTRVSEMQRSRELAIASAVEKAKGEMSASAPNADDLAKKHMQELEALRAEHEIALKQAVDAAVAAAKAEAPKASTNNDASQAAIDAAIADYNQKMQAKHAEEISAAVERGRMEQAAKGKLKDAQLVRSQTKLKELEAQVLEWRKAGLIPDATTAAAATATPASPAVVQPPATTPTTPVASTTSKLPATTATTTSTSTSAPAPAPMISKPGPAANPPPPAPTTTTAPPPLRRPLGGATPLGSTDLGRGRGAPRGRAGGARGGLSTRGAAPPSQHAHAASAVGGGGGGGMQIMGAAAAAKRGRDDEATLPDDSLAKRLKPAVSEATTATTAGAGADASTTTAGSSKPPVAIRRPPPS